MVERALASGNPGPGDAAERRMMERFLASRSVAPDLPVVQPAVVDSKPASVDSEPEFVDAFRRPLSLRIVTGLGTFPAPSHSVPPSLPGPPKVPKRTRVTPVRRRPAPAARRPILAEEVDERIKEALDQAKKEEMYLVLDVDDAPLRDEESRYECPLCMENILRVRIGPCGHCTCVKCAKHAWGSTGVCAVCSTPIDGMMRLFIG